jgi:hypothetical protein
MRNARVRSGRPNVVSVSRQSFNGEPSVVSTDSAACASMGTATRRFAIYYRRRSPLPVNMNGTTLPQSLQSQTYLRDYD